MQPITFDYIYGSRSESFSFYRIPRLLVTGEQFQGLSTDAKLLYGLMLDRMDLSAKNGWYDSQGRVYIYYSLDEIQRAMNCGHDKAVKMLAELDTGKGIGLIERVKQGQGRPARIYMSSSLRPPGCQMGNCRREKWMSQTQRGEIKKFQIQKCRLREIKLPDFWKTEVLTSEKPKGTIPRPTIPTGTISINLSI